jgi:hypothetical protein
VAKAKTVYQLKITLAHIKSPIWRRLEVPDCSLERLHEIIQLSFGWEFSHLWEFDVGGEHYGLDPDGDLEFGDPRRVKLGQLVRDGTTKFKYTYDFGDTWEHVIEVQKAVDAEPKVKYPRCTAGKRSGPPEDCGGPWGYADFLDAIQNPKHKSHDDMLEWIGGEFDPEAFSAEAVNKELARLR